MFLPFSDNKKCIFIHIPKCAGTSIEVSMGITKQYPQIGLEPTSSRPNLKTLFGGGLQHLTVKEIKHNYPHLWKEKDFSFTVVRDPVRRFVSHFLWKHYRFSDVEPPKLKMLDDLTEYLQKTLDFSRSNPFFTNPFDGMIYCEDDLNSIHINDINRHLLPQCCYIFSSETVQVDFLFNIENMQQVESFLKQEGVVVEDVSKRMVSKVGKDLHQSLPSKVVDTIESIYHHDMRLVNAVRGKSQKRTMRLCQGFELNELGLNRRSERGVHSITNTQPSYGVPKKLWMYWHQGWDHAPKLVRECRRSWEKLNPTWEVIPLDRDNLDHYIALPDFYAEILNLSVAALSDVIRIHLLSSHGGVWADATTFNTRSLDEWIWNVTGQSDFFAYAKPVPGRPIASWFLASTPENYMSVQFKNATNSLWRRVVEFGASPFEELFDQKEAKEQSETRKLVYKPLTHDLLSDDPHSKYYFWFHMLFGQLHETDETFRRMWTDVPEISADGPHYLQQMGLLTASNGDVEFHIHNRLANIYKLHRRFELPEDVSGTTIGQLFDSLE